MKKHNLMGKFLTATLVASMAISPATVFAATNQTYKYNNNVNYKQKYGDYMNQFFKAPENVDAYFDHGFPIDINELCVTFKKVDYAKSYDVMVSKDNNFKVTKTYTTDKNSLRVKAANDDFITPHWHGRYVKVRANYGYGMHSKWSEPEMVGCGKLHLDQDFDNVPE
mgnify:FL=1